MTPKAKTITAVGVAVVALLLVGGGIFWFLRDDAPDEVNLDTAAQGVTTTTADESTTTTAGGGTATPDGIDGTWSVDTSTGAFDYESATGTFVGSFSQRHFTSSCPSFNPRPPITMRSGMPTRSASLNFTPGR